MNTREIREKTGRGECVFGTLITSPAPMWPQALSRSGLDFVFIDTEHVAIGRETLSRMCYAFRSVGLPPLVRIGPKDPEQARQALDGGAAMIVAPYIETVKQVQELRGATKLRPIQGHRLQQVLSGEQPLSGEIGEYVERLNQNTILLVNIESIYAIENLDEILAVPDLDGVLVGPNDLSCSLEIPVQYGDPRFSEALRAIVTKTREKGLIAAAHFINCGPIEMAMEWIDAGVNMMIKDTDLNFVIRGLSKDISDLKEGIGQGGKNPDAETVVV